MNLSHTGIALTGIGLVAICVSIAARLRGHSWIGFLFWGAGHVVYGVGMLTDNFHARTPTGATIMMVTVSLVAVGVILMVRDFSVMGRRERGG